MKKTFAILALAIASIGSNVAAAAEPIVIKFSHVVADDTPKGRAANRFKELAEKYTNKAVRVDVHANGTLYKDKEEMEALQMGSVQMLAPSLAKFGPLGVKEFEAFDLPYIFDNYQEVHDVQNSAFGKKLFQKLEGRGITGLSWWDNGFKSFSANKPIHSPDDLKGQKMRIQSSKILDAEMRSVGALPQTIGFNETYQALSTGVVDGTENPISNFYTQKMHEVQKHLTLTDHGYLGYAVIANKKFWDGLPADIKGQLTKALAESTTYANAIAKQENDAALEAVKKSGKTTVYVPSAAEKAVFRKAMVPVHTQMADRIGKEALVEIESITGFKAN